jgi:hypothetical protein
MMANEQHWAGTVEYAGFSMGGVTMITLSWTLSIASMMITAFAAVYQLQGGAKV